MPLKKEMVYIWRNVKEVASNDGLYAPTGQGLYAGSGMQSEQFLLELQIYGDITDKPKRKSTTTKLWT